MAAVPALKCLFPTPPIKNPLEEKTCRLEPTICSWKPGDPRWLRRLEGTETGELLPEGITAWTWVHSRAFAGAGFQEANKEISDTRTSLGPAAHG